MNVQISQFPPLMMKWLVDKIHHVMFGILLTLTVHLHSMLRHAPQNLTVPIMVEILPVNDNNPVVTVETLETTYIEGGEPQLIVPNITIIDEDETCENDQLIYARIRVLTMANDSYGDQLMVRCNKISLVPSQLFNSPRGKMSTLNSIWRDLRKGYCNNEIIFDA